MTSTHTGAGRLAAPRRDRAAAWGRDAFLALAFSLLTALSAQVTIHLPCSVPITGQTFAVLLTGALLGPRLGALTMLLYLAEGAGRPAGLRRGPQRLDARHAARLSRIFGPTAGYLFSYPFAAALVGWLAERGWDRKPLTMLAAMLLGSLVIFALGAGWLAHFVGPSHAFAARRPAVPAGRRPESPAGGGPAAAGLEAGWGRSVA